METLIYYTGAISLLSLLINFLLFIYRQFIRSPTSWMSYKGSWALVTGASEGIGQSFAVHLAKQGMNVIILARSQEKLKNVSKEVEKFGVKSIIVVGDLTKESTYDDIKKVIKKVGKVEVLVNNAGGGVGSFKHYMDFTEEDEESIRWLNMGSVEKLVRMVLPQMLESKKGRILNIGTLAALSIGPYLIPYTSNKSKLHTYTQALNLEYSDSGVEIQCAVFGKVASPGLFGALPEGSKGKDGLSQSLSWDCPSPMEMASVTLKQYGCGGAIIIPYWSHALQNYMINQFLPSWIRELTIKTIFKGIYNNTTRKQ